MVTISIEYGSAIETTASASPERQHVHGEELRAPAPAMPRAP